MLVVSHYYICCWYCYCWKKYYLCNEIFAHFQEKLFVDVQSVSQMLAKYNSIIQSLSEPEVSIKLKSIREAWTTTRTRATAQPLQKMVCWIAKCNNTHTQRNTINHAEHQMLFVSIVLCGILSLSLSISNDCWCKFFLVDIHSIMYCIVYVRTSYIYFGVFESSAIEKVSAKRQPARWPDSKLKMLRMNRRVEPPPPMPLPSSSSSLHKHLMNNTPILHFTCASQLSRFFLSLYVQRILLNKFTFFQ